MKLLPTLALIAGGAFVLSKMATANVASRLNFVLGGISTSFSGINPIVTVNLIVQNPTSGSFTVNSIVGNVLVNGALIGNISMFTPVQIPANGQVPLPLNILLNPVQVLTDVLNLLAGTAGSQVVVIVQGTANVDNLTIPIAIQYNLL
jgi:hypothetical protein